MATFTITFNDEKNYVHVQFFDALTIETANSFFKALAPFHDPEPDSILDFSEASLGSFTTENLKEIVSNRAKLTDRHHIKVALVAPKDLEFGFMRMYHSLASEEVPQDRKTFRSTTEAVAWIEESNPPKR